MRAVVRAPRFDLWVQMPCNTRVRRVGCVGPVPQSGAGLTPGMVCLICRLRGCCASAFVLGPHRAWWETIPSYLKRITREEKVENGWFCRK